MSPDNTARSNAERYFEELQKQPDALVSEMLNILTNPSANASCRPECAILLRRVRTFSCFVSIRNRFRLKARHWPVSELGTTRLLGSRARSDPYCSTQTMLECVCLTARTFLWPSQVLVKKDPPIWDSVSPAIQASTSLLLLLLPCSAAQGSLVVAAAQVVWVMLCREQRRRNCWICSRRSKVLLFTARLVERPPRLASQNPAPTIHELCKWLQPLFLSHLFPPLLPHTWHPRSSDL